MSVAYSESLRLELIQSSHEYLLKLVQVFRLHDQRWPKATGLSAIDSKEYTVVAQRREKLISVLRRFTVKSCNSSDVTDIINIIRGYLVGMIQDAPELFTADFHPIQKILFLDGLDN